MKKILSIFAFVLLLTFLVACGDKPEEVLATAKDELAITFATGDSATSVTKDLATLPSAIGDIVVTWKSSNTTYLANDGKVSRGMTDFNVTLEATLTLEDQNVKVPFVLTIKADSLNTLEAAFEASYATTLGDDEFEATDNLSLVTTFDGATVTWSSNNPAVISNAGVVTRQAYAGGDQTVILTASLVKGLLTAEVEFLVFVPKFDLTVSEKLQQALAVVTTFPVVDGISSNQEFLTTAKDSQDNEYTVVWSSSHPAIITSAGVVVQPADADTVVTMTASITVGTVTETKTVTFNVFKQVDNTITASMIAEGIAEVVFPTGKYITDEPFIFENLTVIGLIANGYVMTDGVDVILFDTLTPALTKGQVYDVTGAIYSDYGVYRIRANTGIPAVATLVTDAVATYPTQEVVTDLSAWVTAKPSFDQTGYFQHDFIRVTARVYVQSGLGSYDTYLVSPTWADWNNSSVNLVNGTLFATPALMSHYRSNIADLRALHGKVVTLDVMIHSFRTDKLVWYFNFVGTTSDIEMVLTDVESVDAAESSVNALIASKYVENTTVTLPTTLFGATIQWSTNKETVFNSVTGAVTLPVEGVEEVVVTAVITKNAATKTVVVNTSVGDVALTNIGDLYLTTSTIEVNDIIKIKGLLVAQNSTSSWWIQDATGGLNIFVPSALRDAFALYQVGTEIQITGVFGKNNGLFRIQDFTAQGVEIINSTPVALPEPQDISNVAFTNEALYDYMGQLVSFEGYILKDTVTATGGYINIVLINPLTGAEIPGFFHTAAKGYAAALAGIKLFVAGDTVDVTGAILGFNNNNYQLVVTGNHFSAGTDYTEAQLAAYAESKLVVPAASAVVEGDLTLPVTGLFGSTVAWTTSNANAISTAGVVVRGSNDVVVTLGYTLTLGATVLTEKTVEVTVAKATVIQKDLFISEYIEGSSNNKALEIYNGTDAAVDLSTYSVGLYSNGATVGLFYQLTGTLAAGEVFVMANSAANATILAQADVTIGYAAGQFGVNWNGDDAVALLKNGVVIDVIGEIGVRPSNPASWPAGLGSTLDRTIVRNETVLYPSNVYDSTQWTAHPIDTFTLIGSHTVVVPRELYISEYIEGSSNNKALEIYNGTGVAVDLSTYSVGLYSNGTTVGLFYQLTGTLAAGEVFVMANSAANAAILAEADVTIGYAAGQFGVNWNGDDAVALLKDGVVIDIIGEIGVRPASPASWPAGLGSTLDRTIVRNPSVINPTNVYDSTQWTAHPVDTFTLIGSHTAD